MTRLRAAGPASRDHEPAGQIRAAIFAPISDVRQRFLDECVINLTEVVETRDSAESIAAFQRVLQSLPAGDLFFQEAEVFRNWAAHVNDARAVRWSSEGAPRESTQASFTLAHAFVAQTGSILTSSLCGGRGASIVPACHVVFGKKNQLVADLEAAMEKASRELSGASFVGLISGSSRTADIEKILVQGAHGPRRVVIILQEQE